MNQKELDLLKNLNTRIILGFESRDEFVRNVLYNKVLLINEFESTVLKIKKLGFEVGALVFAGIPPLNNKETIIDVKKTLTYLYKKKVVPVVMFQNIQPNTIPNQLLDSKQYKMIEPRTVLEITKFLVTKFKNTKNRKDWFIADPLGGPPEPIKHIFNQKSITCKICSKIIINTIRELRINRDNNYLFEKYKKLKTCPCYLKYKNLLRKEISGNLNKRTEKMLTFLEKNLK